VQAIKKNKLIFLFTGWNSSWTKSLAAHPNLWAVLEAFGEKESWSSAVYAQSSFVVGGKGCVGAAVGGRKTTGDQKCQNLQSLAKDFAKLRRRDYLMRMIAIMHPLF
jgi:hypothetical protein